jgi:16S rRNA (cytosine1402-N4)-methyltransferase
MEALALKDGGLYADATFGGGGYSRAMLEQADCRVIGLDRDPDAEIRAAALRATHENRFTFKAGRFGDLATLIDEPLDGIAFDLGVSSFQFDEAERGFSFQADADLDMRMEKSGPSAADAVNNLSEVALMDLLLGYGEDHDARRIARAITQARAAAPITRTSVLADVIERGVGGRQGARIHPATKAFQALRILVNDELSEIARGLCAAEALLKQGGRLVVVSFHSLEDRLAKNFITERADARGRGSRHAPDLPPERAPSFALERRRSTAPGDEEVLVNPRARSASLRYAIRTDAPRWPEIEAPSLAPKAEAEWARLGA